jgi:uncharacterized membrane protein YcaP (DUF421 family)
MRFLGRRAIHQLTSFDLLLIIALGSAMGDPMIYPDVVILWSVFGITSIMVELIPKLKNYLFELDFEIIIRATDQEIGSDTL